MDRPPRISEVPARAAPGEVLTGEPATQQRLSLPQPPRQPEAVTPIEVLPPEPAAAPGSDEGRPIHALSALLLVAVDSLWAVFDWAPPIWLAAIPFCFLAVFVPTFLIQRHLKNDSKGRALAFASLFGVLAAIPTPVTGTVVGLGLLSWTGLGKLLGTRPPKQL